MYWMAGATLYGARELRRVDIGAGLRSLDHPRARATLDAIHALQQAGAVVLTTNYDSLLSDATGLPPVTWEEHEALAHALQDRRSAILHIHGHWQRPSSIVLGSTSYERVVADTLFQQALRSLWLTHAWVYIGCGDGLDDPNIGRLLEWGKAWGDGAQPSTRLGSSDLEAISSPRHHTRAASPAARRPGTPAPGDPRGSAGGRGRGSHFS